MMKYETILHKLGTSNMIMTHNTIILPTAYVLVLCDYSCPQSEIMDQAEQIALCNRS